MADPKGRGRPFLYRWVCPQCQTVLQTALEMAYKPLCKAHKGLKAVQMTLDRGR